MQENVKKKEKLKSTRIEKRKFFDEKKINKNEDKFA